MSSLLEIEQLSRRYRDTVALDHVDLEVDEGSVLGLIGPNGAGKTTLIRHVMGLLKAQSGRVRVFDRDPVKSPELTLALIGYVSEDRDLPGWMRIEELLRYTRAFFPAWDDTLAEELLNAFDLDVRQKVKTLSRGQHVRTSLVLALAPRPPLLVLDEPSSGLDPVVRRDVLEAVIQHVAHEGRTVLFSSHLLDEVERISDHLAMIDHGRMLFSDPIDSILEGFRHLVLRPTGNGNVESRLAGIAGIREAVTLTTSSPSARTEAPQEIQVLCRFDGLDSEEQLRQRLSASDIDLIETLPATLDEIFLNLTSEGS